MITKNQIWIEKSTRDEVLVTWVSDELVSYSKKRRCKNGQDGSSVYVYARL